MLLLAQLDILLSKKEYVFKGGTSLLVLFDSSSRFSIDVDICMKENEYDNLASLEESFKKNLRPPFTKVELDKDIRSHGGRNIKAAHFYFYYIPKYKTQEQFVLLDIVFQNNSINSQPIKIDSPYLIQNGDALFVNTITVDDLLGDKLTAFAPTTIGVKYTSKNQYGRPKSVEIIKQLYDCAFLTSYFQDINRVTHIYKEIAHFQIKYGSDKQLDATKCLIDTIETCELIISGGKSNRENYNLLLEGMYGFNNYVVGKVLTINELKRKAFLVLIIAYKVLRIIDSTKRKENKYDYLIRTGIKEKELDLIASKEEIDELFKLI